VFGMNAIAAYVFSEMLASVLGSWRVSGDDGSMQGWIYRHIFTSPGVPPSANASLAYSLAFVFVCWLFAFLLYRKRIFLKI